MAGDTAGSREYALRQRDGRIHEAESPCVRSFWIASFPPYHAIWKRGNDMRIRQLELIEGARRARGLTVIIDVFRAFTTEAYAFSRGAKASYPIGDLDEAFAMKKAHPDYILLGERGGAKVEGCDLGNSPYDVTQADFAGKCMIHSTSAGTQGIVQAAGADMILTGSLVNARAVTDYIKAAAPKVVSLVAMGKAGLTPTSEDRICAEYMEALLEEGEYDIDGKIAWLRDHGGEQFFRPGLEHIFPREDYPLCVAYNRFNFVLRAGQDPEGRLVLERVDPPFQG